MWVKIDSSKTVIKYGYSEQEICDSRTVDKENKTTIGYDSGYSGVECDEDVYERFQVLQDYVEPVPITGNIFNIKWSDTKTDAEEILGEDGKSQDPKVYVQSHFKGDDTAKDARILADEWAKIRTERDRLLTNSDWTQGGDTPLTSAKKTAWATYRTKLRDVPKDQKDKTTYASITWPSEPS